jgi:lipoic acid synthetase
MDLRTGGCGILTIGRNACARRPRTRRVVRYYHPDNFRDLKQAALEMGFVHVESGPLVRSS